jgi:hypothetical protein
MIVVLRAPVNRVVVVACLARDARLGVPSRGPVSLRTCLRGGVGQAEQPRRGRAEGHATRLRPVLPR